MSKQTIKSVDQKLDETTNFLINKIAELEVRLEHFIEMTVRTVDYLDRCIEETKF